MWITKPGITNTMPVHFLKTNKNMSTLGGLIRHSFRSKSKKQEPRLSKEKWIEKMKREGKWTDYKKKIK